MTHDDIESPMTPRAAGRAARRSGVFPDPVTIAAVVVGSVLLFVGGWILFVDDPMGGEPSAVASIERRVPRTAAASAEPKPGPESAPSPIMRDGVPVIRPGDAMPKKGPVIIAVPGANDGPAGASASGGAARSGSGRSGPGAVDKALLEDSRYGALPRIAPDGRRPLDLYARPAASAAGGGARVALLVTGLGVSRDATDEALRALPPEVSAAFLPYAGDVAEQIGRARQDGREVFVQAPMEPFDFPANDPGPQTLLTSLPASANLERLRWSLGRAAGYVGVTPLAGGRFLENADALQPMFAELARRGLMFVGAGGRGDRSEAAAAQAGLPHAGGGAIAIDRAPDAAAIDAALARLENEAKAKPGVVSVGQLGASPLTLKRIAAWREGLAARGVTLVPVSAAAGAQGPS
ncbi:divergent polysaccharide deacetylase family protein [Methylopila henanensis]|uniref:Divergent polysaccharide deacetylase family protein n=1 Tax=Methylopila henanensis TaxID=873516 RepID=A0ABW4K8S2_9HYPH